jgi:uncharacterized membrane protein
MRTAYPAANPNGTGATPAASTPTDTPPHEPLPASPSARLTRTAVLCSVVSLIVLGLAWELWLAPTGSGTLAIKVLPLLLPLPGLWRYRLYTYRWLSLLIWLYVGEGLVRSTSESGLSMGLATIEVILGTVVFIGCVMHVRSRLQGKRLTAADNAGLPP